MILNVVDKCGSQNHILCGKHDHVAVVMLRHPFAEPFLGLFVLVVVLEWVENGSQTIIRGMCRSFR